MAHDLRFALRMILSHRWFSAAVVATLALGIGLNTMVFTLINAVLYKPVPVPGGAQLVAIRNRNISQSDNTMRVSYPDFRDYRAQTTSLANLEAASDEEGVISETGNPPQAYQMERASSGIFEMLHIQTVLGRAFLPDDDKPGAAPVLVLGYGIWKDRYGSSPNVIGRQVRVNEKPATIIGVMPKGFKFPTNVEMWMPLAPTTELEKRTDRPLQVFGMLKPDASIAQANADLTGIAHRLAGQYPDTDKDIGVLVETFHERYNGGNIRLIFLLMLAAVGFVLLIACANVANMMLSRALARQREVSIRSALGASRWRVVRQLLIESVLLSTIGGVLGLALAALGVHWFDLSTHNVGKPYWIQFTMDYTVFGYFAALCILSGLLFGTAPALRFSRVDLNDVLKEGARSAGKYRGGRLSSLLVVFQFALTLVLLTGAGVFVHSLLDTLSANRNVPADQLMTARIDFPEERYKDTDTRQRFYDQLMPRLNAIPGVTHVAIGSELPGLGAATSQVEIEHSAVETEAHRPSVSYVVQSPGYFDAINLPILLGRDFNTTDGTASHKSAVLTRQCAEHFWPNQSAIGKRFRFYDDKKKPGDWITVIGISANIIQEFDEKSPNPLLFVPFRQEGWNGMALLVRSSGNPTAAVRAAVQSIDPNLPLRDVYMLPQAIEHQQWYLHLFSKLFSGFALIALLMASVGIYAVIAQATNSRTQEIGVRMALGANAHNIISLVMKRGLWQILAGLALGLAAALPAARLMSSLPLNVSPSDPVVFIVVSLMLALVGLFACWLPARRAAGLDPVKAIRYE
ncbi:ABC transporter permease [Alloacidobacterium dinghuense]|uniref:ABC transporter permease n=1 Tax=Alloacidobacterium dinghuense TaxID=2763107 RepID=A0A7G8BNS1_9BACT|nr:ABC transporter permease [Alloacidobacterium dinghuense]QNI34191.1 ABC transporter permease [Alloacidobacterium dinghuense]